MHNALSATLVAVTITAPILSGCSSSSDAPVGQSSISPTILEIHCVNARIPLTVLPSSSPDEPQLALPKPEGWLSSTEHNSSLVRGAILNPALQANGFIPNAVVTLADVTMDARSSTQAIDNERDGLARNVVISSDAPGTLCGYPSRTVNYTISGRQATTLIIAGKGTNNKIWVSTVGVQTTEPDNPDFVSAKRAILEGFQFRLPKESR